MMSPAERFVREVRDLIPGCFNCEHFRDVTRIEVNSADDRTAIKVEYCGLDEQKRLPPVKIITYGCPQFVREIPF